MHPTREDARPFRRIARQSTPAWRWHQAMLAFAADAGLDPLLDDDTRRVVRFLDGHADRAVKRAVAIFERAEHIRARLESLLLANASHADIAHHLGEDEATIAVYEAIFFDVRARLGDPVWVHRHALGPGWRFGEGPADFHSLVRWVGYRRGGPAIRSVVATARRPNGGRYSMSDPPPSQRLVAAARFDAAADAADVAALSLEAV